MAGLRAPAWMLPWKIRVELGTPNDITPGHGATVRRPKRRRHRPVLPPNIPQRGRNLLRIVMLTTGSRGDVQPYIALARGCVQAGHRVRVATHTDFASLFAGSGIDF